MLVRAARAWCPLLKTVTGTVPQLPCGSESTPPRRYVLFGVLVSVAAIRRLWLRACSACVAHACPGGAAHAAACLHDRWRGIAGKCVQAPWTAYCSGSCSRATAHVLPGMLATCL
eukprot:15485181-Alexandrium_andersonii.AAC.1